MMTKLEVGQIYRQGEIIYPCQENVRFHFDNSGGLLQIFYNQPTVKEIESIRTGKLNIGLVEKNGILLTLFKFGVLNWMDAPFSPHLGPSFEFQEVGSGQGFGITIILINAANGVIKGIRYIGAPTKWSKEFKKITLEHKEMHFDKSEYDKTLREIYENYTTDVLVKMGNTYKM